MTGNLRYRTGTIADLDQLQNLGIIAYSQFENDLTPDNWKIFNDFLQDRQSFLAILSVATCFVCADSDQLVGAAYIIPSGNPTDLFKSEWSYIRMVGVNPKYQGRGVESSAEA
jgi:hypothetical protein